VFTEKLNLYDVGEKLSKPKKPIFILLPEQEYCSRFQNTYKENCLKISEEETCEQTGVTK